MKVIYAPRFKQKLNAQLTYISKDSRARSRAFRDELRQNMESLKTYPFRCRQSIYFDDENVRDMIFKGYTITYRIKADMIEVFGFVKYQKDLD